MHYPLILPLETFLDLHHNLFPLIHYHTPHSNSTLHSTTINNHLNTLNPFSTSQSSNVIRNTLQITKFQTSNPPSTTIRANPHINSTYTQPFTNTSNISSYTFNIPTYITITPSTIPQSTVSHPTYINSSASIFETIKPFDGFDHNCTPSEYLQHIEARVTFSLCLLPTSDHEYKFWHARRMAFIQCSLTGTALSWYIGLYDTYNQDGHAFVQAVKKQFSSQQNARLLRPSRSPKPQ